MASLEDFDRQVKALVAKSKLSSSAVQSLVHLAMTNIASDAHLVSTLFRQHKKAASSSKLTSLYLIDAIAREARSRLKKQVAKGKEPAVVPLDAAASTTPLYSPPPDGAGEGAGTYASFLKKLEAVLGKVVLDCWENGPPEHKEKVRKVLDIWTKAATFSSSVLVRISQKLLASTSSSSTTASPSTRGGGMSPVAPAMSPSGPSISPGPALSPAPDRSTTPSVPANVLALLQATSQAGPSAAAKEQSAQEAAEQEIERVLREAQGGGGPSSTAFARPSQPASTAYAPPASTPGAPPAPAASSGLSLDPAQLAVLQQIAGYQGGSAAAPAQLAQPAAPYGPGQGHDYGQSHGGHRHYGVDASGPGDGGGRGGQSVDEWASRGGDAPGHRRPPAPLQQHAPSRAPYPPHRPSPLVAALDAGPRGQTRARDDPDPDPSDAPVFPAAKRPFEPRAPPPLHPTRASPPPPPPHPHPPYPTPSGGSAAPPPPPQQQQQPPPSTQAPPPFNPSPFDATSPAAWSAFVDVLRASHPYFAAGAGAGPRRTPTMEEVAMLCVPSAVGAFGWPVQSASAGAGAGAGAAGGGRHAAVSGMMGTMAGGAGGGGMTGAGTGGPQDPGQGQGQGRGGYGGLQAQQPGYGVRPGLGQQQGYGQYGGGPGGGGNGSEPQGGGGW